MKVCTLHVLLLGAMPCVGTPEVRFIQQSTRKVRFTYLLIYVEMGIYTAMYIASISRHISPRSFTQFRERLPQNAVRPSQLLLYEPSCMCRRHADDILTGLDHRNRGDCVDNWLRRMYCRPVFCQRGAPPVLLSSRKVLVLEDPRRPIYKSYFPWTATAQSP